MQRPRRSHATMIDPEALGAATYVFFVRRPRSFYGQDLQKGDRLEVRSDEKEKLSRALTLAAPLSGTFRHEAIIPAETKEPPAADEAPSEESDDDESSD